MIGSILVLIVGILSLYSWWFRKINKYDSIANIPALKPIVPFVGNAFSFGRTPQAILWNLCRFCKQYGGIFKVIVGSDCRFVVTDPDIVEKVVISYDHIKKSDNYDLLREWFGDGLLTSSGSKWKQRRKLLTPCFHFAILDKFLKMFDSAGEELVGRLQKEVGGDSFNVFPYVNLSSLMLMCETAMGLKMDPETKANTEYREAVHGFLSMAVKRIFSPWKRNNFLFSFSSEYKIYYKFLEVLQEYARSIIGKRRTDNSVIDFDANTTDNIGMKSKTALMDFLLKAERENLLNEQDTLDEINTFLFAGHDTSSTALGYLIWILSKHQEVQEEVFQEIIHVFGSDAVISTQSLNDLNYLDCVLKETMRMYPPVPLIERALQSELVIGDIKIPPETTISIFVYGLHHNENYYENPEIFDPLRFLPENVSKRHNYAYIPFSAGPRNCIGQRFALLSLKTIVVKLLLKYKILPVDKFEPDMGLSGVLQSFNGIRIRLYNRESTDKNNTNNN